MSNKIVVIPQIQSNFSHYDHKSSLTFQRSTHEKHKHLNFLYPLCNCTCRSLAINRTEHQNWPCGSSLDSINFLIFQLMAEVSERRIRPIQDAVNSQQWKQALQLCDKWHKKGEKSDRFQVGETSRPASLSYTKFLISGLGHQSLGACKAARPGVCHPRPG